MDNQCILLNIACHGFSLETSTIKLSAELGISQQSVSRKLILLEKEGMIARQASPRGITIEVTPAGKRLLREKYLQLRAIFEGATTISGKLISGLGEGSYYIGQKEYQGQIKEKLGFRPYPGTLNLKTDDFPINDAIEIAGFTTKERTFGPLKCYPVKIGGIAGAVVVPARTHLKGILEIIAPVFLRKELGLKDGDKIDVEVLE